MFSLPQSQDRAYFLHEKPFLICENTTEILHVTIPAVARVPRSPGMTGFLYRSSSTILDLRSKPPSRAEFSPLSSLLFLKQIKT